MKTKLSILLVALFLPATSFAQEPLPQGARIRLTPNKGVPVVATLRSMSTDSLTFVDSYGNQHTIAQHNVAALQRSVGRERRFWKHLGIGIGATAAVGGMISSATWEECTPTGFMSCFMVPESRGEALIYGVLAGAVIGIPVGALAGALIKVERWDPVYLRGQSRGFVLSTSFAIN